MVLNFKDYLGRLFNEQEDPNRRISAISIVINDLNQNERSVVENNASPEEFGILLMKEIEPAEIEPGENEEKGAAVSVKFNWLNPDGKPSRVEFSFFTRDGETIEMQNMDIDSRSFSSQTKSFKDVSDVLSFLDNEVFS